MLKFLATKMSLVTESIKEISRDIIHMELISFSIVLPRC